MVCLHFRFCIHGDLVAPCPEGHFCPEGTSVDWQPCPPGTYNNGTGLWLVDQCITCTGGHFCDSYGASEPAGLCVAGHYCEYGMDRADPTGNGTCAGTIVEPR